MATTTTLTLKVTLIEDDLLGGAYEAEPRVAHWASWGAHRLAQVVPLAPVGAAEGVTLGPYALPSAAAVRGDETVWLKEIALTHCSGQPSLDATDKPYVARQLLEGVAGVPLRELLAAARAGTHLDVPLLSVMLEVQLAAEAEGRGQPLSEAALDDASRKAVVRLTPVLAGGASTPTDVLRALEARWAEAAAPDAPLLYGHPRFHAAHVASINATVSDAYSPTFYAGPKGAPAEWPLGAETSLDHLHLPRFVSDQGSQPPVAFWLHDVETRDHPPGTDVHHFAEHYALNADSVAYAETLLDAALVRQGLTRAELVAAVEAQEAQPATETRVSAAYHEASAVPAEMATYLANALYYKSDAGYMNKSYYQTTEAVPARATGTARLARRTDLIVGKHASLPAHAARALARPPSWLSAAARVTGAMLQAGGAVPAHAAGLIEATEMESFDMAPVQGLVNAGDCEDSSNLASTTLRTLRRVAAHASASPALKAVGRLCARRMVADAAASVTAAFVNTEGRELTAAEMRTVTDLPLKGSAEDRRNKEGGHCHGLWIGRGAVYAMLVRAHGRARVDADLPALAREAAAAPAWAAALPTLVLEGTSSVEPWVLPAGEISPELGAKAAQRRALAKVLRAGAPGTGRTSGALALPALLDAFRLEGLSFYATPPPDVEKRRVSTFYLGLSQLMVPELYAMHPLYGQLGVVDTATHTRGADIGAFLRGTLRGTGTVGLVPSFYRMGRARWEKEVRPVMAVIQNQQPLGALLRFASPARPLALPLAPALLANNHVLSGRAVLALGKLGAQPARLGSLLEAHAARLGAGAGADMGAPAAAATLTFCLYTRPWRLGVKPDTAAKLEAELAALRAAGHIARWEYIHDRPLAHADDVLTLCLYLPAK